MKDAEKAALARLKDNYIKLQDRDSELQKAQTAYTNAKVALDCCDSKVTEIKVSIKKDIELIKQCEGEIDLEDIT